MKRGFEKRGSENLTLAEVSHSSPYVFDQSRRFSRISSSSFPMFTPQATGWLSLTSLHLLIATYLLWAGLIIGVSFIATPVKFQASHLTLKVALDVGKVTFHLMTKIEWALMAFVTILSIYGRIERKNWIFIGILTLIVASQGGILLPALDSRIDLIISGVNPPANYLHLIYIFCEFAKLVVLLVGAQYIRELRAGSSALHIDRR